MINSHNQKQLIIVVGLFVLGGMIIRMQRSENSKWVTVLVLASLLLLMDGVEGAQILTLGKHAGGGSWKRSSGGYYEWRRSVGIVCKCCHGEGAAATCTPTAASSSSCSDLRCLPWKFR